MQFDAVPNLERGGSILTITFSDDPRYSPVFQQPLTVAQQKPVEDPYCEDLGMPIMDTHTLGLQKSRRWETFRAGSALLRIQVKYTVI